jgi:hypothetical protein
MILMQRLVTSSTAAIRTTLEKRQALLEAPQPQGNLFENTSPDEWADLDGQSQVDLAVQASGWELEKSEVETRWSWSLLIGGISIIEVRLEVNGIATPAVFAVMFDSRIKSRSASARR